jgi:hypothetical protein
MAKERRKEKKKERKKERKKEKRRSRISLNATRKRPNESK